MRVYKLSNLRTTYFCDEFYRIRIVLKFDISVNNSQNMHGLKSHQTEIIIYSVESNITVSVYERFLISVAQIAQ